MCNQDSKAIHEAFKKDLRELMKKHRVDSITAGDHWTGYAECGQDVRITVEFQFDYKVDTFVIDEIDFGTCFYVEAD